MGPSQRETKDGGSSRVASLLTGSKKRLNESDNVQDEEFMMVVEESAKRRIAAQNYLKSLQQEAKIAIDDTFGDSGKDEPLHKNDEIEMLASKNLDYSSDRVSREREHVAALLKRDELKSKGRQFSNVAKAYSSKNKIIDFKYLIAERHSVPTCVVYGKQNNIFVAFKNGTIVEWDTTTSKPIHRYSVQDTISSDSVAINSLNCEDKLTAAGEEMDKKADACVQSNLNNKKHEPARNKKSIKSDIYALALSPDGRVLVAGGKDRTIRGWKTEGNRNLFCCLKRHQGEITGLCFQTVQSQKKTESDPVPGVMLFSTSSDRTVKIWTTSISLSDNKKDYTAQIAYMDTLFGHQDTIQAVAGLSLERCLTVGGRDRTLRLWKIAEETQLLLRPTENSGGSLNAVCAIDNDHYLTGTDTGSISLWAINKRKPLVTILNANGFLDSTDPIANESKSKVEPDLDSVEDESPKFFKPAATSSVGITVLRALPLSDLFFSASDTGVVRLWAIDTETWRSVQVVREIAVPGCINDGSFSTDGKHIALAIGREHRLGRWDVDKSVKNTTIIISLDPQF